MKHIRYSLTVDRDVDTRYSLGTSDFRQQVHTLLNDPHGWTKFGYRFSLGSKPNVRIRLSSPATIQAICGDGSLSCAELGGRNMYLNADRWMHGSPASKLPLKKYRQYMVSHEIGHILGYDHTGCPCAGCLAPIMMQQTKGIGKCRPNTSVE